MNSATVQEPVIAPLSSGDDDELYEIIDGQRIGLPPIAFQSALLACRVAHQIGSFVDAHDLGFVVTHGLFDLALLADRRRRPKAAYVSYQRWPKDRAIPLTDNGLDVVPELVVEVVSPTDRIEELQEKIHDYFQAGVKLVWVVHPVLGVVHVYESLTAIRGLAPTDELDGGTVLPGFKLPIATLFRAPIGRGLTS